MMMRFLLMDRSFFIISIVFIILFSISDARWFPELSSDRENSKSNPLTITDDDIHAQVAAPKEYQQADGLTVSKSSGSINLSFSIFDEDEEFYVRIQSEDGQKICDGIFSQHELENINCPYEKDILKQGDNLLFITIHSQDRREQIYETTTHYWYPGDPVSQRTPDIWQNLLNEKSISVLMVTVFSTALYLYSKEHDLSSALQKFLQAMFSLLPPSPPPKPPPKPASPKFFPPKPKLSKPSYPPKPYIPKPTPPMISPLDPYPVRPTTHPFRQFAFIVIGVAALLGAGSSYHSGRSAPITADPIPIPITFYPAIPPPAPARPEWKNPLIPIFVGIDKLIEATSIAISEGSRATSDTVGGFLTSFSSSLREGLSDGVDRLQTSLKSISLHPPNMPGKIIFWRTIVVGTAQGVLFVMRKVGLARLGGRYPQHSGSYEYFVPFER